jgi:hypothetical protein
MTPQRTRTVGGNRQCLSGFPSPFWSTGRSLHGLHPAARTSRLGQTGHAKNAVRMDAEIGLKMVEHLLGMFTAARLRLGHASTRCQECGSYGVVGGVCAHCEWTDPDFQPRELPDVNEEERARRPAEPRVPSSDISTFVGPGDFR